MKENDSLLNHAIWIETPIGPNPAATEKKKKKKMCLRKNFLCKYRYIHVLYGIFPGGSSGKLQGNTASELCNGTPDIEMNNNNNKKASAAAGKASSITPFFFLFLFVQPLGCFSRYHVSRWLARHRALSDHARLSRRLSKAVELEACMK